MICNLRLCLVGILFKIHFFLYPLNLLNLYPSEYKKKCTLLKKLLILINGFES